MEMDDNLLRQITTNVMTDMLGIEVAPTPQLDRTKNDLVASVRISGDWEAQLEVRTPVSSARRIASTMFSAHMDDLAEDEVTDALGEIANMIGGNLKGLQDGETRLSLPCVGKDCDEYEDPAQEPGEFLNFRFGLETLSLRVLQRKLAGSA